MSAHAAGAELAERAQVALAVDWVTAACMTCLLYDYLITLDQEVTCLWSMRFSLPKVLFFLNRYVVVTMLVFNAVASSLRHLSSPFCIFYLRWLDINITVTNTIVEGILLTRISALFHDSKPVQYIALALYAAGSCTSLGLTISDYVASGPVAVVEDFSLFPGCFPASVPRLVAGYWIAPIIVESFMFVMVVMRAFAWSREVGHVPQSLRLIARDSAIYYAAIFVMLVANLLVFEIASPFLSSLMVTPCNTVGCIAGSRMLLNLRGLGEPAHSDWDTSLPEFAEVTTIGHHRMREHPHPDAHRERELAGISTGLASVNAGMSSATWRSPTRRQSLQDWWGAQAPLQATAT